MQGTAPVMSTGIGLFYISCSPLTRRAEAAFCFWSLSSRARSSSLPRAVQAQPLWASAHGRSLQLLETSWTHKGSTDWQRHHRPDTSLWHMAWPEVNYIHTCTNKLFRKLLETVFPVSIFSNLFPDPHFSQVHPLMPWDLKRASFIPTVLSTGSLWATQHSSWGIRLVQSSPHWGISNETTNLQNHPFLQKKSKTKQKNLVITVFL